MMFIIFSLSLRFISGAKGGSKGVLWTVHIQDQTAQNVHRPSSLILDYTVNPFPNKPCLQYKSFENTVEEKENCLQRAIYLFPHSVFYRFGELSAIFIKFNIVVCKTLSV